MSKYKDWVLVARPWSFTMSAISVTVGAALAATHTHFSWFLWMLSLVALVFLHGGVNLLNDFWDVKAGIDQIDTGTRQYRPHPLAEGRIKPATVLWISILLFTLGAAMGLYLAYLRGWEIIWIGITGIAAGVFYTAPPFSYKYKALGEFSVLLMWGPLSVEGAYFIQTQSFSWAAFWVSLPFGVLVALVLFANNLRDVDTDARAGVTNLAIFFGKRNGPIIYAAMVLISFSGVVIMSIFGPLGLWSLIVLLALPLALKLMRTMIRGVPRDADARTAQLNTVFGALLVISLALESLL